MYIPRSIDLAFEEACQVFIRPALHVEDVTIGEEPRHAVIGLTENWALLFVVHLLREDDVLRIISARPATAQERRLYEDCD
jgi:uncharacterized DUF497 family protein